MGNWRYVPFAGAVSKPPNGRLLEMEVLAMKMQDIREIAKQHGVKSSRMSKIALVRSIQQVEGNFDCFASAVDGSCDQLDCRWREECFASAKRRKQ